MEESFEYYLSLCAIVKNEGPYLDEWLKYHQLVGVEKFYIYDNESTDDTKKILQKYIKKKQVEYTYWRENPGQVPAYNDCIKKNKNKTFWMGFIDLDEFIVPVSRKSIPEILIEYDKYSGLAINWMIYGSSGYCTKTQGFQIQKYLYRARKNFHANKTIKTILNPRKINHMGVHEADYSVGFGVDENKRKVDGPITDKVSVEKIRINHYFTRSKQEFLDKINRGRADDLNPRTFNDFKKFNKNSVYDPLIKKYGEKIRHI